MSAPNVTATAALRRALDLLGRASIEWQNGDPSMPGPLHWRMAIMVAQRELRQALEALESPQWSRPTSGAPLCRHCGGTGFEGDEACEFCSATGREAHLEDALRGSVWWNSISPADRRHWLHIADSAVPADAWAAYKHEDLAQL